MEEIIRIAISGSYGGSNLGDEAILQSIICQLRESTPCHITVLTHDPEDTLIRHNVEKVVNPHKLSPKELQEIVQSLDVFVLGGGGILYDEALEFYLRPVEMASEAGVPVFVYAISAGPLIIPSNKEMLVRVLNNVRVLTVRDKYARKLLEDIGVQKEILVTADPVVLLRPEELPKDALLQEGIISKKRLIALSVREPGPAAPDIDINHYHTLLADVADFLVERINVHIVFIPMERRCKDLNHAHAVIAKMHNPQHATVLQHEYSSGQLLSWMGHFEFAIGMRLHFLIFAAIMGVPFVPLPYAGKVQGFIESLTLKMPPFSEVTSGRLLAHVDYSWDTKDRLSSLIKEKFVSIQEQARVTNQHLVSLIEERRKWKKKNANLKSAGGF